MTKTQYGSFKKKAIWEFQEKKLDMKTGMDILMKQ
jgi:hypothetical protein